MKIHDSEEVDSWMRRPVATVEKMLKMISDSAPALTTIRVVKTGSPKFFIDYCSIRQCVSNEFTIAKVVDAVETIGATLVELDTDLQGETALLRRIFCVFELFATIKTKGVLLVCGPALRDAQKTLELAGLAADDKRCQEVVDSATAKCRWPAEEELIKKYVEESVGFARTDKIVLVVIVQACVQSAVGAFEQAADGGAAVLHSVGRMLLDVGDYTGAKVPLESALEKLVMLHGEEAQETAETLCLLGRCHASMSADPSYWGGKPCRGNKEWGALPWYERSLRLEVRRFSEDSAATARSLVGIGASHGV
jgi:hypothetical protein